MASPKAAQYVHRHAPPLLTVYDQVVYLGTFNGTLECQQSCLQQQERCWSFVHYPEASQLPPSSHKGLTGQCFGLTSPGFNPSYEVAAVSGVVHW